MAFGGVATGSMNAHVADRATGTTSSITLISAALVRPMPTATPPMMGRKAAAVAVFAGLGVAAGLLVPETKFVPWIRLAVEWLEVLAFIVVGGVKRALGPTMPMADVDWRIWGSAIGLMVVIGLIVGVLPALRGMRLKIVDALAGR